MSIDKGIKSGSYIYKGQIVGNVGKTGTATAPHLHFGVISNNKYVDPLKLQIANHKILDHKELVKFHHYKNNIMTLLTKLDKHSEIEIDEIQDKFLLNILDIFFESY